MPILDGATSKHCHTMPVIADHIGSYYIRGYLQGAVYKGFDPEAILKQADIYPSVYTDPNASITGEQLQRLILTTREVMNDHYMGFLQVPGKLGMDSHAGRVAVCEETLGEGLRQLCDFINVVRSDEEREYVADTESGEFSLIYRFSDLVEGMDAHLLYWFRMYWGYKFYCWLTGQRIKLTRVCFSSPEPAEAIDYQRVFNCSIEFNQPNNRLCFDQRHLVKPVIRNEVELLSGDFPQRFSNWFTIPGSDQSLSSQVEQILIELHREGMYSPTAKVIAGILSMSSRTLTRKLGKEKTSFQKIKTKVRCELAKKLLLSSDVPVTQIAVRVGFAEPGDFTRAFIGWTGQTPSSYRANAGH